MPSHKFRIGQMVDFVPAQRYSAASCSYKILRLLPSEGGERLYRIKTITEGCDRVVRESELRAPLKRDDRLERQSPRGWDGRGAA
jgi:hypothetical protein